MSNLVRCSTCGRAGLPPVPNSRLGSGELTHPVAHVRERVDLYNLVVGAEPCLQGVTRDLLAVCVEPGIMAPRIDEQKRMIWATDALWEL